ncbi:MAG TPA: KH domain-containing protein [Acidimicrobiia bacterium]|nr:KH domain-containing protein [Acidimicrobiia bacterium]
MAKGEIVKRVLDYVVGQIVDDPNAVEVTIIEQGPDDVIAEVRTGPGDMGRVIGRRGRTARSIRTVAQAAADEEGITASVEFED